MLRSAFGAIWHRYRGLPEWPHLEEAYDWLARQEAKGKKIGEDLDIEEEERKRRRREPENLDVTYTHTHTKKLFALCPLGLLLYTTTIENY